VTTHCARTRSAFSRRGGTRRAPPHQKTRRGWATDLRDARAVRSDASGSWVVEDVLVHLAEAVRQVCSSVCKAERWPRCPLWRAKVGAVVVPPGANRAVEITHADPLSKVHVGPRRVRLVPHPRVGAEVARAPRARLVEEPRETNKRTLCVLVHTGHLLISHRSTEG
jgi:hypothetical protein